MTIQFFMDESVAATAKAMGSVPVAEGQIAPCALSVGDTISFPGFRRAWYRVVSRHFRQGAQPGETVWLLKLEPVEPFG